jgi:enamine deaminase RidA (YjgF/YER057c/UK114 family)
MTRQIIDVPADSALFGDGKAFKEFGYAPAVRAGDLLFISGQIGRKADGSCPDDVGQQVDIVFARTFEILRWVGLTKDDLVEVYSYHVDLPNSVDQFIEAKSRHLTPNFPAWTALGVTALALPQLKIEMRSIAAFRS